MCESIGHRPLWGRCPKNWYKINPLRSKVGDVLSYWWLSIQSLCINTFPPFLPYFYTFPPSFAAILGLLGSVGDVLSDWWVSVQSAVSQRRTLLFGDVYINESEYGEEESITCRWCLQMVVTDDGRRLFFKVVLAVGEESIICWWCLQMVVTYDVCRLFSYVMLADGGYRWCLKSIL